MKMQLIDKMGSDLKIVNAARRSFSKEKEVFDEKDANLIRFLARGLTVPETKDLVKSLAQCQLDDKEHILELMNKYRGTSEHWVPFAHCWVTFHVEMPIFTARQLIRHTVGVVISEMSRRYVSEDPDYYFPNEWRKAPDNKKQGSSDKVLSKEDDALVHQLVREYCEMGSKLYRKMVDDIGIAPEMARMHLPQNLYTDWHWTISLVTAARICRQRLDPHAQKEIQILVEPLARQMREAYPVAWDALMNYGTGEI